MKPCSRVRLRRPRIFAAACVLLAPGPSAGGFAAAEAIPTFHSPGSTQGTSVPARVAIQRSTYTYKRAGDLEIKADVHRLNDREIRPVVVWIHGGALMMGGRDRIGRHLQQLAQEGAIIVSIDYRLAPETKLPAIIEDLEDAFKWVRARGPELFQADPRRIGVWGGSAGGYLTLTAGFRVNPRPQVLVSLYGYGDLIGDWYSQPSPHARHRTKPMSAAVARAHVNGPPVANAGDRRQTSDRWQADAFYQFCRVHGIWPQEVSGWDPVREARRYDPYMPVKNVTPEYPPTVLLHGTADTDVPFEQSVMMAAEFEKHGVPHRFIPLANGEHGFGGADPVLVEAAHQAAIALTRQHLGLPDPKAATPPAR